MPVQCTACVLITLWHGFKQICCHKKAAKVYSPKVVSDLKWFVAYIKSEMYIAERKSFEEIYEHNLKKS